jgi:uncharacterized membrane protein
MRMLSITMTILAILLLSGALTAPVMAESYESVYTNQRVSDGDSLYAGGCYLDFGIANGSLHVHISSPDYPPKDENIPAGQTSYYYNVLRIFVHSISGSSASVNVDKVSSASQPSTGTCVRCDIPGQTALGGDVVSFPLVIQNNDQSDHTYELSAFSDVSWKTWFEYGGKGIYKIYVPGKQSKTIDMKVQTWGNTPVGEKKVWGYASDVRFEVYVDITSANQSADVSYKVTSKIAYIGDKITYDLHIKNVQARENLYKLAVTGLPDNWYYRFKESATSAEEMAEVIIPESSGKDLVLEIVPPYSVGTGSYNFTAVVTTPDGVAIKKDLTLNLKSGISMSVDSTRLAYEAKPGEAFSIVVYVSNTGQGSALTSVYLETKAPEGWLIQTSPNRTNSIKAGESQAFTLAVQPPGNIVASDYEVNVKVKSDQAEKEKDYRITIKTDSIIPYLGAGIIVLVVVGLFLIYRKYGRR